MRSIGRFSARKLTQIALQTANLVEFPTECGDFSDSGMPKVVIIDANFCR